MTWSLQDLQGPPAHLEGPPTQSLCSFLHAAATVRRPASLSPLQQGTESSSSRDPLLAIASVTSAPAQPLSNRSRFRQNLVPRMVLAKVASIASLLCCDA